MYNGTEDAAGAATLTSMDTIDGGAGTDTLKVVDATAIDTTAIVGLTVTSVEKINLTSAAGVTANTSTWTGVNALTIKAGDDVTATASATTDVAVTATALSTDGTAAAELSVNGGQAVTVTASDTSTTGAASANQIIVGATTAAAGAVSVTYTETISDAADAGVAGSTIAVTGGTTVEVNSLAVAGTGSAAGDVLTLGAVTVNGKATTAVTVKQTAATATWAATGDKIKITNGAVTIADANATTTSDTIATVTLENFGLATITSTALSTLNLTGGTQASGNLDLIKSAADTTTAPTSLTVNAAGGSIGILGVAASSTMANAYTAVNIASSKATTFADAGLAANKTLTASGAGVTTFTAFTAANNAALTSVVSTGAGLTIGTALATGVAVTGGAGVETISIAATTKAISLGDGDDVLTVSVTSLGAGGSANGGNGNDTLVANTNGSSFIADPAFGGFEVLRVAGAAAQGAHNANGFTALEVGAIGGGNASVTNVAANVGLTQLATLGNDFTFTLANATGTNDSVNLTLKSSGAIGAAGDTITLAGVETVNITTTDTNTTAHQDTVELVATSAKTITVKGNAGLIYTNADSSITTFDASGVAVPKVTDNGVVFTSTNTTVGEVVTIKGSNGVDTLTGSATAADTIYGNSGADNLVYTGGNDVLYGGEGKDKFDITSIGGDSTTKVTIADLAVGDTIDMDALTAVSNAGVWNSTAVSLGANATLAQYLDAAAAAVNGAGVAADIRWFQFGGDTYIVVDDSADTTFVATDTLIKITGLISLTNSTVAAEILTVV